MSGSQSRHSRDILVTTWSQDPNPDSAKIYASRCGVGIQSRHSRDILVTTWSQDPNPDSVKIYASRCGVTDSDLTQPQYRFSQHSLDLVLTRWRHGLRPDAAEILFSRRNHDLLARRKDEIPVFKRLLPTIAKHFPYVRTMGLRGRTRLVDYRLFFVTTTCNSFIPLIEPIPMKELLMKSLNFCNEKYHAALVGYALMPEHLHLLVYFREENHLSEYMREFKKFTSVQIRKYWEVENPEMIKKITVNTPIQTYKVWMDRFDDLHLYSTKVCYTKLRYINNNPVERGLCERPQDYEYSSAAFYAGKTDNKTDLVHLHDLL